jgi:ADP-ribose pyrophosphatase
MGCDLSKDSIPNSGFREANGFKVHVYMGNNANRPASAVKPAPTPKMHFKCRAELYPRGDNIKRFPVPDGMVSWDKDNPGYNPLEYTTESVLKQPVWADIDFRIATSPVPAKWNELDGKVDRRSHMGPYQVVGKVPRNPVGRTGLCARGALGRWGPNHAADPIVTRWKRNDAGNIVKDPHTGRSILQFIAIQRRDTKEWAIPGGMVDAGEKVSVTLKREFSEEAMNSLQATPEQKKLLEGSMTKLFSLGTEIYRGYVDDPRNTDNSWMETVAVNFHDDKGDSVGQFNLNAAVA